MALSSSPHLLLLMYLLSLAVIVGRATVNALGECYFPGVPPAYAAGYLPCDKYAVTSVCCMAGWTCFDNKLCIATDPGIVNGSDDGVELGTVMRGTCTNPEWDGEACGDFCLNNPVLENNGSITPCSSSSSSTESFCCTPAAEEGTCDCGTGKGTFDLTQGEALTVIGVEGLLYTSYTFPSPAITSISSSTSARHTTTTSSTSQTGTTTGTKSPTSFATTSTSSPSTTATAAAHSSNGPSTAAKAGIGAGVGVVALAVIGIAVFFLTRRQRQRHTDRGNYPPGADSDSDIFAATTAADDRGGGAAPQMRSPVPPTYAGGNPSRHVWLSPSRTDDAAGGGDEYGVGRGNSVRNPLDRRTSLYEGT